jgi:hypothetical protein
MNDSKVVIVFACIIYNIIYYIINKYIHDDGS